MVLRGRAAGDGRGARPDPPGLRARRPARRTPGAPARLASRLTGAITASCDTKGISEQLLRWKGIEATEKVAASPNTKVVIIGTGKDGLPLILDTK